MQRKTDETKNYAGLLAAVVHTAASVTWSAACLVSVLCLGAVCAVQWLGRGRALRPWVQTAGAWWGIALVVQSMDWMRSYWPGETGLIPLAGLALATWCAWKGREVEARAVTVLRYIIVPLVLITLLAGIRDVQAAQLMPKWGMGSGELAAVLLTLGLLGEGKHTGRGIWLLAGTALFASIVVSGVLPEGMETTENCFYQYSRSISLIGAVKRFEGLAAAGITLGLMALQCELLGRITPESGEGGERQVLTAGAAAAGFYLVCGRFTPELLVIGSVLMYLMLPLTSLLFSEKKLKKRY